MTTRGTICLLALALLGGCAGSDARRPRLAADIAPLSEADFDRFATEISEQILSALRRCGYTLPASIAPPRAHHGGVESGPVAGAFGRRLAEGISDRLGGAVRFRRSALNEPRLRSSVEFSAEASDRRQRAITFVLWDADLTRELVRCSFEYRERPKRIARRAARTKERATEREIDIDADERGLAVLVQRQASAYGHLTITGPSGRVIFLDDDDRRRFALRGQCATRTADDRFRVELEIRARGRRRDAELRVIFLDADDQQVEVTPVLKYRFQSDYTKTVAVTADHPRAAYYICLLQSD